MKVLLVNTTDRGGAAKACLRLHYGLLSLGIDSKVLLLENTNNFEQTYLFRKNKKSLSLFNRISNKLIKLYFRKYYSKHRRTDKNSYLKTRDNKLELFSFPDTEYDITTHDLYKQADIVNLHWVAGFVDIASFLLKNSKPIVWTMHDMNCFSGGEHYLQHQLGMDSNGFPIKRKLNVLDKEIQMGILEFKKLAYKNQKQMEFVAPSIWLKNEAQKSTLLKKRRIHHIPYGLDEKVFTIQNPNIAKEKLNLPLDKKVILFVSDFISNERKGFDYLLKALKLIDNKDIVLCTIGHNQFDSPQIANSISFGKVKDEERMSVIYNAADVFIIPSLMDNLPNTVLESLMCGTPVIGFPVGGIIDMIETGENGILTNKISVVDLKTSIDQFLDNGVKLRSKEIRKKAIEKYELTVQANSYKKLFEKMI